MLTRGIRVAASGMEAVARAQDVTANNLANVTTTGFKKDMAVFRSFASVLSETASKKAPKVDVPQALTPATDRSQGALVKTDNPFDLALSGEGFFAIETPEGTRYTRAGSFTVNQAGELCTHEGYAVMGQGGPINIPANGKVTFGANGTVYADGSELDRLRIVTCAPEQRFTKAGENLFALDGDEQEAEGASVQSGFLEQSTVNSVSEMVSMIAHLRSFEAMQKVIRTQDDTLDKAVNSVGRV